MKKLLVVVGADRVGKSTFIEKLARDIDIEVFHFSESKNHPTEDFEESLYTATKESIVFDRGWPDRFIYEQVRNHGGTGLWDYMRNFEIDLFKAGLEVFLLGITRPWNFSAPLHLEEFSREYSQFEVSKALERARNEHHKVQELLVEYFNYFTIFPNFIINNPEEDIESYIERIGGWLENNE